MSIFSNGWSIHQGQRLQDAGDEAMKATILLAVNLLVAPLVSPPEIAEKIKA
jgi:hypothetical protein